MADNLTAQANPFQPNGGGPRIDDLTDPQAEGTLARRFIDQEFEAVRYTPEWGYWHYWKKHVWKKDVMTEVPRRVREFLAIQSAAMPNGHGRKIYSSGAVTAIDKLSRLDGRVMMESSRWDSDPMMLNTPGGIVDLRTGVCHPSNPSHYCTRSTLVAPGGSCLRWMMFLDRVTEGDAEMIKFLQRVAGYCLTGSIREECLLFLYGVGGNGKGTYIGALKNILGDYSRTASLDLLMETYGDQHPTELAGLNGARFVTTDETSENKRWNEGKLKSLTGGDTVTARFMRQDFFDFIPQFKLILSGNHRPSFKSVDEAIRRRLVLVPFTVNINPVDKKFKENLHDQYSGILEWAIEGCLEWQKQGLNPPPKVREASSDYLEVEDTFGTWMDTFTELKNGFEEGSSRLFESWVRFCEERNEHPGTQKAFSFKLQDRGLKSKRISKGMIFQGVRLK